MGIFKTSWRWKGFSELGERASYKNIFQYIKISHAVEPALNGHLNFQRKLAVKDMWSHKRRVK